MIPLLLLVACAPHIPETTPGGPSVDLVVHGTVIPGDVERYIAVRDGIITAVTAERDPEWDGAPTLEAPLVTAGFVDAHAHPYGLGRLADRLVLTELPTYAATLAAFDDAPGEGWILGRGWDQNDWSDAPEGGWPLAVDLDAHTGERPAAVRRVDGHAVWLNTAALRAAGIDANTPDPEGGRLVRDAEGVPTGVLIDTAMDLVPAAPEPRDDVRRWLLGAAEQLTSAGLTGVHAMGVSDGVLDVYEELARTGELDLRVWIYVEPESRAHQRLVAHGPWSTGRVSVMGVKAFADGALGSRGALLTDPYSDEPEHRGAAIHAPAQIQHWATELLAVDASMAVHAIGDAAVHDTLDAFAAALAVRPEAARPLRVEHAQLVRPEDRPRFAELGVVTSMQPTHATSDMPWAEDRVGSERIDWAYSWRTLRDSGALLAFGSDLPVESHRPALGMWSAVHRTDRSGHPPGGWHPEERLTRDEAVEAFTTGAARAVGSTGGSLSVGAPADLSLWTVAEDGLWEPLGVVIEGEALGGSSAANGDEPRP